MVVYGLKKDVCTQLWHCRPLYIDYNQHWDSEYRPHRHTYSHICWLRNMLVIAQLIERSNNVGENGIAAAPRAAAYIQRNPHMSYKPVGTAASSVAPGTFAWRPLRPLCKGRATAQVKLNVLSRASLQVQNGHLRDARCPQRGPVPPYRLGRPERSRPELPTAPKPKSGKSTSVVRRR